MNDLRNTKDGGPSKKYQSDKIKLFFLGLLITFAYLLLFQLSGLSKIISSLSEEIFKARYITIGVFISAFAGIHYMIELPLKLYGEFGLEKRYDLSNQKLSGWLKDEIKRSVLSGGLYLTAVELFYLLLARSGRSWWLWLALIWFLFSVFFARIFPTIILPIFYKYKEIGDPVLRRELIEFSRQNKVPVLDVFQIDLSAKTKKANAALTGLGRSRRIILADTLLDKYSTEEIKAVLAHEIGHHKYRHIWMLIAFGALSNLSIFFLIDRMSGILTHSLGILRLDDLAAFPALCFIFMVFGLITMPLYNAFSRILEKQADRFALETTHNSGAFISCMEKLCEQNLSDAKPGKFTEFMFYDHPPISERIALAGKSGE